MLNFRLFKCDVTLCILGQLLRGSQLVPQSGLCYSHGSLIFLYQEISNFLISNFPRSVPCHLLCTVQGGNFPLSLARKGT